MNIEEVKKQIESWKSQQKAIEAEYNKLTGAISAFGFLLTKMEATTTQPENMVKSTENRSQLEGSGDNN